MGSSSPGSNKQRAFTLIEILVVVVVIGIALALIAPNLFPDERAAATTETEKIFHALELARDEAVFSGRPVAAEFAETQLGFFERDLNDVSKWNPSNRENLKPLTLPKDLRDLKFGNEEKHIIFLPAGVGVPFTITLVYQQSQHVISGDPLGNLAIKHLSQ